MLWAVNADLELAHELADLADRITTRYFGGGRPVPWQAKEDGSPVTAADAEVEEALRIRVAECRLSDGFLGEEVGATGEGTRRWVVDGIDGTDNFAAGRPEWGTLVALEVAGEIALGVATSPGLGQRWWAARGEGAWTAPLSGGGPSGGPRRLSVSKRSWREARAAIVPPLEALTGWYLSVAQQIVAGLGGPMSAGFGPLLVPNGQLELAVHLGGGIWDYAVWAILVEEAGGTFGDLWGGRRLDTATAVYANNSGMLERVVDLVQGHLPQGPPDQQVQ